MNDAQFPWVEEFRPQKIEDVILSEDLIPKFKEFIENKSIPHLMLTGCPGIGKTTIAKIISKEISGTGNYLYINASDQRDIDTIRTTIVDFCSVMSMDDCIKIIILDEADGLTPVSQKALRGVMEEFAKDSRFILTANFDNKIIDAIHSRCQKFSFDKPTPTAIAKRCLYILQQKKVQNIKESIEDIKKLVKDFYPDIRLTINNLQKHVKNDVFSYKTGIVEETLRLKLIEFIKTGNIKSIREEILNDSTDYVSLYDLLYKNVKEICSDPVKIGSVIVLIADYCYKHQTHLISDLNFIACIIEIIGVIKK